MLLVRVCFFKYIQGMAGVVDFDITRVSSNYAVDIVYGPKYNIKPDFELCDLGLWNLDILDKYPGGELNREFSVCKLASG